MEVNKLAFFGSALKAVMHGSSESEAKIQIFSKCGTIVRRQENQKRRSDNRNKEIRIANCEGRKMLVELILDGRESVSLSIEKLERFRIAKLKLQSHLETVDIHF